MHKPTSFTIAFALLLVGASPVAAQAVPLKVYYAGPQDLLIQEKLNTTGNLQLVMHLADAIRMASQSKFRLNKWRLDINCVDMLTLPLGNA